MSSSGRQIFANLEFPSKRKRRATLVGTGYTEYQTEVIFLKLLVSKKLLLHTHHKAPI